MMGQTLTAKYIEPVFSVEGPQAIVHLTEPNGDLHAVRCLCRRDGSTEVGEVGNGQHMAYLTARYGTPAVVELLRDTTLGGMFRYFPH